MLMVSRAHKNPFSDWWWTIDKPLLVLLLLLLLTGFLLSFSASPPAAATLGYDSFYFVKRHAFFGIISVFVLCLVSFCDLRDVRRLSLFVLLGSLIILALLPFLGIGVTTKGATRWISLGSFTLQPSEFFKPAFVIITAWLFSENARQPDIPCNLFSIALLIVSCGLLISQPDLGQTILVSLVWFGLFFLAGISWFFVFCLLILGISGLLFAYLTFPHVSTRIDNFVMGTGDTFQVDRGLTAITHGGWFGTGPGEGTIKRSVPESHTDFVFSVVAEEFGIIFSLILLSAYGVIIFLAFMRAFRERDDFVRLSVCGLTLLFGLQALINIGVNLRLIPAKGMTLPFVSYGGSSLLAMGLGMGFLLALTRRRADFYRHAATNRIVR